MICLLIICVTVTGLLPTTTASASVGTFRTTGDVNVRSEPSTDASVVTVVYNSTNVEVLDHNPAGWSRVQVSGSTGFIRSDFLKFPISNFATFRTTDGVNLRASASTNSRIVSTVLAGTNVEVLEHNPAGWSSVRHDGSTGFIRSDFLTRGGDGASVSSSAASGSGSTAATGVTAKLTRVVNFRNGASTDAGIIRTLPVGTNVEVLENQSNGWSSVSHDGTTGFIRSDLLTDSSTSATPATPITLRTTSAVNLRSGPSTNDTILRSVAANTNVEVVEQHSNGWSSVRHEGTAGFIRSDLLSSGSSTSQTVIKTLRTTTGVNLRSGPSTDHSRLDGVAANTSVDIFEELSNGWSRVRVNGINGYIKSEFLGVGARAIELLDWSEARGIVPTGVDLRVVDVRTGITFNIRGFSKSGHMDVEPPTADDTNAILRSRNGVWAWAPRPVWVTVGERTFAAALNGMPHDVSTISGNGMNGHLCLHFNNTVTNSKTYQRDLNNAVMEAYNARPR